MGNFFFLILEILIFLLEQVIHIKVIAAIYGQWLLSHWNITRKIESKEIST